MYHYAIRFEDCGSAGVALSCRDLPELNSSAPTAGRAESEALDAIETTLSIYVDQRRAIPEASAPQTGERVIYLPAATVAKIELWNALRAKDMRKADLARLLGIHPVQADRLTDFLHPSKMGSLERALAKLGRRLTVGSEALRTA